MMANDCELRSDATYMYILVYSIVFHNHINMLYNNFLFGSIVLIVNTYYDFVDKHFIN